MKEREFEGKAADSLKSESLRYPLTQDNQPVLVSGDSAEKDEASGRLIIRDTAGKIVGEFRLNDIVQWYRPAREEG
jgi:hypothetical protein